MPGTEPDIRLIPYSSALLSPVTALWNTVFQDKRHSAAIKPGDFYSRIIDQPVFDPAGLILAVSGREVIGLVHAIAPVADISFVYSGLRCQDNGTIAVIAVHPRRRRRGIASRLLEAAERYLFGRVASGKKISVSDYFVPLYHTLEGPRQPFWGDTEFFGIEADNQGVNRFFHHHGYRPLGNPGQEIAMTAVLDNREEPEIPDLDGLQLREVRVSQRRPWAGRIGWYPPDSCWGYAHRLFGPYRHDVLGLAHGATLQSQLEWYPLRPLGWIALWDMLVDQHYRGHGLGAYLLDKALWLMQRQGYHTVELHTNTHKNAQACDMYCRRGFSVVQRWLSLEKTVYG